MIKPKDLRDRRKPVFFFFAMLAAVIVIEYSTQRYYDDLNKCMSSLYADRLMPANYLLKLNDQLHQKQRWQSGGSIESSLSQQNLKRSNDSISSLITLYEKTFLTQSETELWQQFKAHLQKYNKSEDELAVNGKELIRAVQPEMGASFDGAISTLSRLSELQTQEGFKIQNSSKSILNGNFLQHILEIALLVMIGLVAIYWFRTEGMVLTVPPAPSAN
jgi:hypothetical protein